MAAAYGNSRRESRFVLMRVREEEPAEPHDFRNLFARPSAPKNAWLSARFYTSRTGAGLLWQRHRPNVLPGRWLPALYRWGLDPIELGRIKLLKPLLSRRGSAVANCCCWAALCLTSRLDRVASDVSSEARCRRAQRSDAAPVAHLVRSPKRSIEFLEVQQAGRALGRRPKTKKTQKRHRIRRNCTHHKQYSRHRKNARVHVRRRRLRLSRKKTSSY